MVPPAGANPLARLQPTYEGMNHMRMNQLLPLVLLLAPPLVLANEPDNSVVEWDDIVGVITAPNVNNPVANIASGTLPWSVREGHARVNLENGQLSFAVRGLVLNGGAATGTTGPIANVIGTLVCGAGGASQ